MCFEVLDWGISGQKMSKTSTTSTIICLFVYFGSLRSPQYIDCMLLSSFQSVVLSILCPCAVIVCQEHTDDHV